MNETPAVPPSNKAALFAVFFVVFIDLLGFGIVLPLMPRYADDYMRGYNDDQKGIVIGILYSSFSLMQFLFTPMWGRLSDRVGRKPMLILGLSGSVVFYALFGYASTIPAEEATLALGLLLLSRVGAGISGASVSTAAAVIADSTAPEKRKHGMALIGMAFGLGFTFGPLIAYAGLIWLPQEPDPMNPLKTQVQLAWHWVPGGIASALSAFALLLAIFKLPETLKPGAPPAAKHGFGLSRTMSVLKMPSIGPLILIYFLAIVAFANFESTLALFNKYSFKFGDDQNFLVFAGVGFVLMVAQGGFYRRFAKKMSELSLMKAGVGMMFLGLGGLGAVGYVVSLNPDNASTYRTVFYFASAVAVFGFAFLNPSVNALISRRADPHRQGEILGVNQSFSALGRIVGPFVGSYVFFLHPSHALPFMVAGGLLLIVVLLLTPVAKGGNEEVSKPSH
jgi:MFS family permease